MILEYWKKLLGISYEAVEKVEEVADVVVETAENIIDEVNEAVEEVVEDVKLASMTKAQLVEYGQSKGVELSMKMKKDEMISALNN